MKESGRIPFAYVFAVMLSLLIILSSIYLASLNVQRRISGERFQEESLENLREIDDMVQTKAYHIAMECIYNLTKIRNPNVYILDSQIRDNFTKYIKNHFPWESQDFNITVTSYNITLIMDYRKTRDFIKSFDFQWNYLYAFNYTSLPVYPRIVGYITYHYLDKHSGYEFTKTFKMNKNIYSPLPLLKFCFDEFNSSTTNFGDFGRLLRYILTTVVEYRALLGYASGAYDGNEIDIKKILTKDDVEKCVNLALVLQSLRFFRSYDNKTVEQLGIKSIVDKYVDNGTIDAADIFFLWNLTDQNFSVGKVLGQSVYGYADRFVYELLMLFWGNPSSEYFCDPTLKEPITNWTEVRNKGEEWAKQMLWIYLDKWRKWLDIPLNLQGGTATASTTIVVDDGNPDTPQVTITMTWTIQVYDITNTTNILLYDSGQRPKLQITTTASPDVVGPRTYYYDLIRESFVEKHQSYGSGGPYFNTLKYVIDALTRAMKHQSDVYDDTQNKGLVDYAAYSIANNIGKRTAHYKRNPNDNYTILLNETHDLIYGQNEPYSYGISQLKNLASSEQENWWKEGAYKEYKYGNDADAYLYDLFRNTVSLWYEVIVNLYDGCTQWQLPDNPGSYGADCESWPPTNQQSVGIDGMGSPPQGSFKIHRDMVTDFYLRLKSYAISIGQPIAVTPSGWPNVWEQCKMDSDYARDSTLGATPNGISYQLQQHGLRSGIDDKTDYNAFSTNFYNFVKDKVGRRFLGSGKLIENMSEWVEESFDVLWKIVEKNANFTTIPTFMAANTSKYLFWERFYDGAIKNRTLKNESIVVDFSPDVLRGSNLSVDIVYPNRGHRFVDVQDLSYNMSMAPFVYDFIVNVSGNFTINLRTNRTSLLHGGMHTYTWYNDTISFNISLRIPLYTAWYIESGWNKYDVKFNYTRGYFGVDTKDSKTDPFFVSKYLNDAIYHYENIGEIKSRFLCFSLPATSVMKNEIASWNKTYTSIILYAFNITQRRLENNDSVWSSLYNDVQSLTSNNYLQDFKFNYFGRDFEISSDEVRENTTYMKCIADISNHKFHGNYKEGNFSWKFNITKDNVSLIQEGFYDLWWHNSTIYRKNPTKFYRVSYSSVSGKKLNIYIEQLNETCEVDFGIVSRKDVSKFKNAFPKNVSSNQEGFLSGIKKMVSNLYINYSKDIKMPFGIFIKIENSTYTIWFNGKNSSEFLLWINEVMRDFVYKVGSQEFPAFGYIMAYMNKTSYMLDNLNLNFTYLSSSVFGCFHNMDFWAEYNNYVILGKYIFSPH